MQQCQVQTLIEPTYNVVDNQIFILEVLLGHSAPLLAGHVYAVGRALGDQRGSLLLLLLITLDGLRHLHHLETDEVEEGALRARLTPRTRRHDSMAHHGVRIEQKEQKEQTVSE